MSKRSITSTPQQRNGDISSMFCLLSLITYSTRTISDVEGEQVADFIAEIKETHNEYLSSSVSLDCNESLHIGVGAILYSNIYNPIFGIIFDNIEAHDLLFPSCSKAMFFYQNELKPSKQSLIISTRRLEQAKQSSAPSNCL